ncbi:restriction endonuclease PvuRts1 I [Bifidobacterium saguini DSM 23967]|uniref:Restriction endonuclease PvuRts1 I n=2 Tax=Bifidobacterium saguini TaxID=762210 RepID=A0A087D9Q1_9BIFI|nr:restriction endonuclease PvuRts1 I [Bifidobacterium saguini DSM 23967]
MENTTKQESIVRNHAPLDKTLFLLRQSSAPTRVFKEFVIQIVRKKLDTCDLDMVIDQRVLCSNGFGTSVDLYLPQIKLGIEICCPTQIDIPAPHESIQRTSVRDVLLQIRDTDYFPLQMDASGSYEEFMQSIDDCIALIQDEISRRKQLGTFGARLDKKKEYANYYQEKHAIIVADNVIFPSIETVIETLCSDASHVNTQSFIIPDSMRRTYGSRYCLWFPRLTVGGHDMVRRGWNTWLSEDGNRIHEWKQENNNNDETTSIGDNPGCLRVTFAETLNAATMQKEYQFVGVFRPISSSMNGYLHHYQRIETTFPIILNS